jgi:hypothetical protein
MLSIQNIVMNLFNLNNVQTIVKKMFLDIPYEVFLFVVLYSMIFLKMEINLEDEFLD